MYTDIVLATECRQAGNLAIGHSQAGKSPVSSSPTFVLALDIKTL